MTSRVPLSNGPPYHAAWRAKPHGGFRADRGHYSYWTAAAARRDGHDSTICGYW
jgi:hypothetical protein